MSSRYVLAVSDMDERTEWSNLPHHILVSIFSYLNATDRTKAALTCRLWSTVLSSPLLWTAFDFHFHSSPNQERIVKCVDSNGRYFKKVYIELDQSGEENRKLACEIIRKLATLKERRLQRFKVCFTGENPYFYAGKEFVDALRILFGPSPQGCTIINNLIEVDFSRLKVAYDDELINVLSANNPHVEWLNIQNDILVCKVSPTCILRLVQRCRKLKGLYLYNCSISEDILIALTEDERAPLKHLSLICRREEKYAKDISTDVWKALTKKLPDLRVSLGFDHTCPLYKVPEVMKPEVPVTELRLETFTHIYEEIRQATSYYKHILEKVIINTPMSHKSTELNEALVELAVQCKKLRSIHVFCVLYQDTVDKILALHPNILENKTYTLKCTAEPHPWIAGNDC